MNTLYALRKRRRARR